MAGPQSMARGPHVRTLLRVLRKRRPVVAAFLVLCTFLWVAVFADFLAGRLPILGTLRCPAETATDWVVLANVIPPSGTCAAARGSSTGAVVWGLRPLLPWTGSEPGAARFVPPFHQRVHPLGTDSQGRDVLAAVLFGARAAIGTASAAAALLVLLGCVLGGLGGYYGGRIDNAVSRIVAVSLAFPPLLLALLTQALLQTPSATALILSVVCTRWGEVARIVRAEVLRVQHQDYLLASRALGAAPPSILLRHVLPNVRSQALVCAAFALSTVVLVEAACGFLGYGLRTGQPGWGELMAQVKQQPHALWLLAVPGLPLVLLVLCQNYVADALRDGLDPHYHEDGDS
jgi:peptide/nickel transport system permease protein